MRGTLGLLVVSLVVSTTGCAMLFDLQAGPAISTSKSEGHDGVAVNAAGDIGIGEWGVATGFGAELRAKRAPNVSQFALGPNWFVVWGENPRGSSTPRVGALFRAGFPLVQIERVDRHGAFGMFSPRVEAGGFLRISDVVVATLGGTFEWDIRFTHGVPNEGYACVLAGVAILSTESL